MTNLFIFNTDFRVRDNPALYHSAKNGESLVAMFIHNPKKWENLGFFAQFILNINNTFTIDYSAEPKTTPFS